MRYVSHVGMLLDGWNSYCMNGPGHVCATMEVSQPVKETERMRSKQVVRCMFRGTHVYGGNDDDVDSN